MKATRSVAAVGLGIGVALALVLYFGSRDGVHADQNPYEVSFSLRPVPKNTVQSKTIQASLMFYGRGTHRVNYSEARQYVVMESKGGVPSKLKVSFGDLVTDSNFDEIQPDWESVSRKAFIARRKGNTYSVTDLEGRPVPQNENDYVTHFLPAGGRAPIALMLNGQTLRTGDLLRETESLKSRLESKLSKYGLGKIEDLKAGLSSKSRFQGEKTAIFMLKMKAKGSKRFKDLKMDLNGQLVVGVPSGRPIALKIDGPVTMKYSPKTTPDGTAKGKERLLRGTYSLVIQTQTDFPKEEDVRKYYYGDDRWYIGSPVRTGPGGRGTGRRGGAVRGGVRR